jgi:hypothetical protein
MVETRKSRDEDGWSGWCRQRYERDTRGIRGEREERECPFPNETDNVPVRAKRAAARLKTFMARWWW